MKKYIFMTCNLHTLGGMQAYIAGKAKYLESIGWKVYVFFPGSDKPDCPIKFLNKYTDGGSTLLLQLPWEMPCYVKNIFLRMLEKQIKREKGDEIIIETHNDTMAPWGELLAKRLRAKHITALLNEVYSGPQKYYQEKIDLYKFKLKRKELPFGESKARLLFNDMSLLEKNEIRMFRIDEDPVQDILSSDIDAITHNDWNIGYIGRAVKNYLPNIIDGICEFARKHPDHTIQFVVIGDFTCRREYYNEKSLGISNLKIVELGNRFPLPRCYFDKVDVVIAGSGSARCSVYEGTPTLVADANNFQCNGLLGYDTKSSIRCEVDDVQMSFAQGLEKALVLKDYQNKTFDYPPKPGVAECVEQNFEFIATSEQKKEYYSEKELCKGQKKKMDTRTVIKLFLRCYFPKIYEQIMKKIRQK